MPQRIEAGDLRAGGFGLFGALSVAHFLDEQALPGEAFDERPRLGWNLSRGDTGARTGQSG